MSELNKAFEYIKNFVEKDSSVCILDGYGAEFTVKCKNILPVLFFDFKIYTMQNSICFSLKDVLNLSKSNKFQNMPTYKFNIIDHFEKETDGTVLVNAYNKIKSMVEGLNKSVYKSIDIIEEKFLINFDTENEENWI